MSSTEQELIVYLQDHDANCPTCGYHLNHLTSARCPECGSELILGVGVGMPILGPWALIAACFCWTGGLGCILIAVIWQFGMVRLGTDLVAQRFFQGAVFYFIATIPLSIITLIIRRRFIAIAAARQWRSALAVLFLTLLNLGVFGWVIVFKR